LKTILVNDTRHARWPLLTKHRSADLIQAEWKRYFDGFYPTDFPLVPIVGARAEFIHCPETEIPLNIHQNKNGTFSALPPAGSELDSRFDGLTIDDLRLYRLDWPALCREVALNFELAGQIRDMPDLPLFWRLGDLHANSHHYAYFLAVIREDPDVDVVIAALKSNLTARLLVPSLSDPAFHRLTEAKIIFHVLADGMNPHFPDVATSITESDREEPTLAVGIKKMNAIEDKMDRVLKHVAGVPPLVEKAAEALANPIAAADELRRQWPLTSEETKIRDAIIAHGGTGKGAANALGLSEATVSRARSTIRRKMKTAGFPDDIIFRPAAGHKVHVGKPDKPGEQPTISYEAPSEDWQYDTDTRNKIIRDYVAASPADKAVMRQHYPDIEAEAAELARE